MASNSDVSPPSSASSAGRTTLLRRIAGRMRRRPDEALNSIAIIEASQRFDKAWYLRQYPDVLDSGMDPIQHYVRHGAAEGRDPTESFSTTHYLKDNPDVAASGMNPFRHYLEHGEGESRLGRQTPGGQRDTGQVTADLEAIARSGLFDARYYLESNPDVAASGMDALDHFCRYGFRELRNPSPEFSTGWYWLTYLPLDLSSNPLADYLGRKKHADVRPAGNLSPQDTQILVDIATRLLEQEQTHPTELYVRLGIGMALLKQWREATNAFSRALMENWSDAKLHARLATVLRKQGKWWQAVDSWSAATNLNPSKASWFFRLGEAQEKMNRFELAAEAYQKAIDLEPDHPDWYFRMGYMREKAGQESLAEAAYREAITRDPRENVKSFGIGVFHQARGYWPEALQAYAEKLCEAPDNPDLHFKLGMALDRCYRWQEALAVYRNGLALKPGAAYWHYRSGFVLERLGRFSEAAEAYGAGCALSTRHESYWRYRQGYVLALAGKHKEACWAYLQTRPPHGPPLVPDFTPVVPMEDKDSQAAGAFSTLLDAKPIEKALRIDATRADNHYLLGLSRENSGNWAGAIEAYTDAVARSNFHRPAWYYRLGLVLFRSERFAEACGAFRETRILRRPFGVDTTKYQADAIQLRLIKYNEYLEVLSVKKHHILYESMHGASVGGNPFAIFEHILELSEYADWVHIWVLAEGVPAPTNLRSRANVIFVERQSDLYVRYLATASHLISDVTFPYWFIRRPEQKYLNTWHGTPLKKLGKDIPGEFMVHGNVQRNLLHATHLISPNPHTSDVLMNSYDVAGIITAKLAETGYPRIDRMLHATREKRADICKQLGLKDGIPVVLYAPTWRGIHGQAEFNVNRLRDDIFALSKLPCQVVFRGHHMIESMLDESDLPVAIARQDMDTSDVLAIADILITDYSSILFDFLPLHRPILLYCFDLGQYSQQRGLYFNMREMPGQVCEDVNALVVALSRQLAQGPASVNYSAALKMFSAQEDGKATDRVVKFFFQDDDTHTVRRYDDSRRSLLFFAGHFVPNGITSSFLNLADSLVEFGQDRLSIICDPKRIGAEPSWMEKFGELPLEVGRLLRVGHMVQSPEECWIQERLDARRHLPSELMWESVHNTYKRELVRLTGNARVDAYINFEGYSGFWTTIMGIGAHPKTNIAYLHNDMVEEYRVRHPYLASVFAMYGYYRRLVSVSVEMSDVNRRKMGAECGLSPSLFVPCNNTISVGEILRRSEEELDPDLKPWLARRFCFVTMGRLSPEKGHLKLIRAFAKVCAEEADACLVIMGDGPLKEKLRAEVRKLDLERVVVLAGRRRNPFPALARCACFVLPSNHEGQPMVLLEALTLGRPIIATDIDGNRAVLAGGQGCLVENSVDGLKSGMQRFIGGKLSLREFDAKEYQKGAAQMFQKIVEQTDIGPCL